MKREDALKARSTRDFWAPTMNKRSDEEDKARWNAGIVQCSGANKLSLEFLVKDGESVWTGVRLAALEAWTEDLQAFCKVEEKALQRLVLTAIDGRYLLFEKFGEAQIWTNDDDNRKTSLLYSLQMVFFEESSAFYVCPVLIS